MLLDYLFKALLIPNNASFAILLLLYGFYFIDQHKFYYITITTLFTIICSCYLKTIWQIPLNPEIFKSGYAYPSGHTMFNIVMYGMILFYYPKLWVLSLSIFSLITGFIAMVYFKFHTWIDISGGICYAGLILIFAYYAIRFFTNSPRKYGLLFSFLSILSLLQIPENHHWHWLTFGFMVPFALSYNMVDLKKFSPLSRIISIALFLGTFAISKRYISSKLFMNFLCGVLQGTLIIIIPHLINSLKNYLFNKSCSKNNF